MSSLIISNNRELYIAISVIIFVQAILSFQGFDVCDEGFSLTFYQQIYNDPLTVEYNFVYWLSGIVGGLWYYLYEDGGILWFRILAIIFNTLTFIVCYKILKQYINIRLVLIGLAMVLFVNDFGYLAFYHNHLTALLAVSSIYFLHRGIRKTHFLSLGVAGLLIGVNVFSRLPNITLFVLILAIPFAGFLNREVFIKSLKPMLMFILGMAMGFVFVFATLYGLDQIDIMKNAALTLINLGKAEGSGHNIMTLLQTYVFHYKRVFTLFCALLIICIFILGVKNYFKTNRFVKGVIYLFGFLLLTILFKKGGIHVVYSIGFIGVLGILLTKQKDTSIKILALLALLMMTFLPLGSGGGINSSGYMCIWLAIPLFLHFISQIKSTTFTFETKYIITSKHLTKAMFKFLSIVFVVSYFTAKAYSISQEAYFDKGSRLKKIHKIYNKYANGIYTTKERATIINNLLANLEKYVNPDDYLLAYDNIPMIHFIFIIKLRNQLRWIL